jgi:5'-3' exonuclease
MGVLRYFRYLLDTHKGKFYKPVKPENPAPVDILLIDCNAIFHPACREVFFPERPSFLKKPLSYEEQELKAFKNVTDKLETLMRICPPQKVLYLAIDGVAGMCKQSQQRKRRYKTAKDRKESGADDSTFDTCHISAGTPFMERLSSYMQDWIVRIKQYPYKHLKIIFDGMHVVSEGEHKLVKWLYNIKNCGPKTSYCIYSPDADLLFLSMCIPRGRGYILRENIYNDIMAHYLLVNCYYLKQAISEKIDWSTDWSTDGSVDGSVDEEKKEEAIERSQDVRADAKSNLAAYSVNKLAYSMNHAVKDYVLFLFLVGNDFLPSMYAFEINNDGINILESTYRSVASENGYLSDASNAMSHGAFVKLFATLAEKEPTLLLKKQLDLMKRCKYPDTLLQETVNQNDEGNYAIDFASFREKFYLKKFGTYNETFIEEVSKAYVRGLHFVLTYYTIAIPSYEWFYEYHYAPLACDIHATISKMVLWQWNKLQEWEYKPPLSLKQALLGVIPPSSYKVLPEDIQKILVTNKDNPLFSEEFTIDLEGKFQDYEGTCLLPNITYTQLKKLVKGKDQHIDACAIMY